jgi:hypothetical protein
MHNNIRSSYQELDRLFLLTTFIVLLRLRLGTRTDRGLCSNFQPYNMATLGIATVVFKSDLPISLRLV